MRLHAGQPAPVFSATDLYDRRIALEDFRGRHLLLSFYRNASCPFCNLRVHELIQHLPQLAEHDLALVAVFQSARAGLLKYVGRQQAPFPLVPDPGRWLYRRYGVESSLGGLLAGGMRRLGTAMRSMRLGYLPGPMDGHKTLIPADFLIGPDGTLLTTYYGRDIADHLPIERLLEMLASQSGQTQRRRAS